MTTITPDAAKAKIYPTVDAAIAHVKRLFPDAGASAESIPGGGYRAGTFARGVFQGYLADEDRA